MPIPFPGPKPPRPTGLHMSDDMIVGRSVRALEGNIQVTVVCTCDPANEPTLLPSTDSVAVCGRCFHKILISKAAFDRSRGHHRPAVAVISIPPTPEEREHFERMQQAPGSGSGSGPGGLGTGA